MPFKRSEDGSWLAYCACAAEARLGRPGGVCGACGGAIPVRIVSIPYEHAAPAELTPPALDGAIDRRLTRPIRKKKPK